MLRSVKNLAATYYSGQSFEIAASQLRALWEGPFYSKETIRQKITWGNLTTLDQGNPCSKLSQPAYNFVLTCFCGQSDFKLETLFTRFLKFCVSSIEPTTPLIHTLKYLRIQFRFRTIFQVWSLTGRSSKSKQNCKLGEFLNMDCNYPFKFCN